MKDNSGNLIYKNTDLSGNTIRNGVKVTRSSSFTERYNKIMEKYYSNTLKYQRNKRLLDTLDKNPTLENKILPDPPKLVRSGDVKQQRIENIKNHINRTYSHVIKNDIYSDDTRPGGYKSDPYKYFTPRTSYGGVSKSRYGSSGLFEGSPSFGLKGVSISPYRPITPPQRKKVDIQIEINNIQDLLTIADEYPYDEAVDYNINLKAIHDIKTPLGKLNKMIGMKNLKENIVDQILFYIQDLQRGTQDFMHTCIYGPPGTGKTEVAKLMGEIFSELGILKKKTFRKVTRSDLIAGFLGQTAMKTRDVIKDALGGVLFIDEAYALGNREKRDSFAKECIDTLCEGLSDHKDELMVIIAGYEKDLRDCFFSFNQGLDSRFTWRFKTDDYDAKELRAIFRKKVKDINWSFENDDVGKEEWFKENIDYFKFYGRDMETLLSKVKISHGRRVFCLSKEKKTVLTQKDLEAGFDKFTDNDEVKNRKKEGVIPECYKGLYM